MPHIMPAPDDVPALTPNGLPPTAAGRVEMFECRMPNSTGSILLFLIAATACGGIGIAVITRLASARSAAPRLGQLVGWSLTLLGFGAVAALAALQLTGRLGPEQLWFRAPTFYVAAVVLLAGALWWFRRPIKPAHARLIRFGLPALALLLLGALALVLRSDGRSAPLAAMLPTWRAPAQEISYFDFAGDLHRLSDLRGKVVLVNFWATWCGPCRHEMPMLSAAQARYRDAGLVVVYLSLEEPEVLRNFLRTHHFEGVQGRLERAADYYQAGKIYPLSYLISRDGRVARRWSGRPGEDWLLESIRAEL